ncbi:MAG: alpha/beta hydrolase [Pseudomonadota bacterium]|nr:alpha/beta hydrolase [Pseudomonadota bacterium]
MYKIIVLFIIGIFTSSCSASKTPAPDNTTFKTIQYKSLTGVDSERVSLDIYSTVDNFSQKPVIIWVHGGGWHLGDKAEGVENLRNLALENGWILVGVNYRLSPRPKLLKIRMDDNRIKYPDHNNDIADAMAWVYKNISKYGGNPNKIALIGHSAGAHLVSLAGTKREFLEDRNIPFSIIKGVASIDIDVYKVDEYVAQGIPMIVNAFGSDPKANRDASPYYHVKKGLSYPHFFLTLRGQERRKNRIMEFANVLKAAKVNVTIVDGSEYSHIGIAKAIGEPKETTITRPLVNFFKECFK